MEDSDSKNKNQNIGLSFLRNILYFFVLCVLFPAVNIIWVLIEGVIFLIFHAMLSLLLMTVFLISFLFIANGTFLAGIPLFLVSYSLYYVFFEIAFFKNVKSCRIDECRRSKFELKKFQYTIYGYFIDKSVSFLDFLYKFLFGSMTKLKNKISSIGIDKSKDFDSQLPKLIRLLGFVFGNLSLLIFGVIHFFIGLIVCISKATWRSLLCIFGVLAVIQAGSTLASVALFLAVTVLFLGGLPLDKTRENRHFVSDFLEIFKIKDFFMNTFKAFRDNVGSYCRRMFHNVP